MRRSFFIAMMLLLIVMNVQAQLGRYNGAMKEAEQTGDGLVNAIKAQWNNTVRSLGDAFSDVAKDSLY